MTRKNDKVVALKERRQSKIIKAKGQRRKRFFIISLIVVAILAVVGLLYNSKFFNIKEIEVKGNKNITDQYVIDRSGIKREDTLFSLPSSKIINRIKKISWVYSVMVFKDWPDTVVIDILEKKPIAFIQLDNGSYLIDRKGFIIDRLRLKSVGKLPKIDQLPINKVKIGQVIDNRSFNNALKAYLALSPNLRAKVTNITARSVNELYFIIQGIEIIYGKAEKIRIKNRFIETMLKAKHEKISAIDVRIPEKPAVRILGR